MPSIAVRTFTDPVEFFTGIRDLHIVGIVQRRGEFRAESTRIDLHRLWMHRFDEDLPRVMKVTPSGKRAGVLFALRPAQPVMQVSGIETSQNQIAKFGLNRDWYHRSSAACAWGTVSLTREDLAVAGETIIGHELGSFSFAGSVAPRATALWRLRNLHEATGHLAKTAPDILAKPEVARAIEQALVEAMVFCLADNDFDKVRVVQRHRARVMRRLEATLAENSEQPLYVADLAVQIGVSYWTLRDCCLEYLGMGPKRYLWLRRMHLARRALRRADAERTTVTEIAAESGFWELGRFSVSYRSLVGESPSTALRRAPDDPRT
jgi:AraC-like DNA-binding protein